jgi:hypothetical protein
VEFDKSQVNVVVFIAMMCTGRGDKARNINLGTGYGLMVRKSPGYPFLGGRVASRSRDGDTDVCARFSVLSYDGRGFVLVSPSIQVILRLS